MQSARTRRRALALAAAGAALGGLSACGFQLRRSAALPFATLHTSFAATSGIGAELRRRVRAADGTRLVDDPSMAEARVEVIGEEREKEVVGFSATGKPREYQLRLRFAFRLVDRDARQLIAPTTIVLHRDLTSTEAELVSRQQEEEILYREMEADLVQQLLRRLAAVRR